MGHLVATEVHQVQLGLEWFSLEAIALLVEAKKWSEVGRQLVF